MDLGNKCQLGLPCEFLGCTMTCHSFIRAQWDFEIFFKQTFYMHSFCSGIFNIYINMLDNICIMDKHMGINFVYIRELVIPVFVEPELSMFNDLEWIRWCKNHITCRV